MERLTDSQKKKILERDEYTSQMQHYSEKGGFQKGCKDCPVAKKGLKRKLNVHHINPNGNGGSNDPQNLITVFECEHTGKMCDGKLVDPNKKFVIHPDMLRGFFEYRKGNKKAIQEVMDRRRPLKENGEIYWNTDHDAELKQTAIERTLNAVNLGWIYKSKKK